MVVCATSEGLLLSSRRSNFIVAASLPIAIAVCANVDWSHHPILLFVVEHLIAVVILKPLLVPFIRYNCASVDDEAHDVLAVRAISGLTVGGTVTHLVVYLLGRTVLLSLALLYICFTLQFQCWGAFVAARLQNQAALSYLPHEIQALSRASILDFLDKLRAPSASSLDLIAAMCELVATARALTALVILGAESRTEALGLLPDDVAERLQRPLVQHLPPRYRELFVEPWAEAQHLRLRRPEMANSAVSASQAQRWSEGERVRGVDEPGGTGGDLPPVTPIAPVVAIPAMPAVSMPTSSAAANASSSSASTPPAQAVNSSSTGTEGIGSDWVLLEPELLVLHAATKRVVSVALNSTRAGRAAQRALATSHAAVAYGRSLLKWAVV